MRPTAEYPRKVYVELTTRCNLRCRMCVKYAHGVIGFQSNGLLLDRSRADRLLAAGLDTVCLSLDSLEPVAGSGGEHHRSPVERAIGHLGLGRVRATRAASVSAWR